VQLAWFYLLSLSRCQGQQVNGNHIWETERNQWQHRVRALPPAFYPEEDKIGHCKGNGQALSLTLEHKEVQGGEAQRCQAPLMLQKDQGPLESGEEDENLSLSTRNQKQSTEVQDGGFAGKNLLLLIFN
jgi:hypothetical protein